MRFSLTSSCMALTTRRGCVELDALGYGGQPFVLLPETSDEKVTTGKMGYGQ